MRVSKSEVAERENRILELLQERKRLTLEDIQTIFGVSPATARRCMQSLENKGKAIRTLKSITLKSEEQYEVDIHQKTTINLFQKQMIARKALEQIKPKDILFLGDGSTVYELAKLLYQVPGIYVITNSILVAHILFFQPGIDLQIVGGTVRNVTGAVTGEKAVEYIKTMHFDKAFLGADSISVEYGVTTPNYYSVMTEVLAIQNSREAYILADGTKFDRVSLTPVVKLDEISTIITDSTAPEAYLEQVREQGTRIIVCER